MSDAQLKGFVYRARGKVSPGLLGAGSAAAMAFGRFGDGKAVRAFALLASLMSLGALAVGSEAERYARTGQSPLFATLSGNPQNIGIFGLRLNAIDYAATGSVTAFGQREPVVPGPFDDSQERR